MTRINKWLEFAKEDLKTAEITFQAELYNQVCFHSPTVRREGFKGLFRITRKGHSQNPFLR